MDISTVPFIRSLLLCPEDRQQVPSDSRTLTATLHTVTYRKVPILLTEGIYIYRVSQEERTKLRECVPYVKVYRYNPKHLYPKLNGYGDNGKRSLKL